MPQQIRSGEGVPYAREALPFSSLQRDLGRMNPPNAGVSNMMDGGNFSKPYTNAQDQRNAEFSQLETLTLSLLPLDTFYNNPY